MFSSIWTKLSGWKIYGISTGYIVLVLMDKLLGLHVDGFIVGDDWLNQVFGGLLVMAGRSTVTSVTGK